MKNFIEKFRKGLFTKAQFLTGTAIVALTMSAIVYAVQSLNLITFTPNTVISASDVNNNFQQIKDHLSQMDNRFIVSSAFDNSMSPSYTSNAFAYDSIEYDNTPYSYATQFTASTNGFTIQEDGFYKITFLRNNNYTSCCPSMELYTNGVYQVYLGNFGSATPQISNYEYFYYSGTTIVLNFSDSESLQMDRKFNKFIFEKLY